jgi:hypothetical protein
MSPEKNNVGTKPISPDGLINLKREMLPTQVLETFNRLIGEKATNGYALILEEEVITELTKQGLKRVDIFDKGWLNIEPLYEEVGWNVDYDSPAYDETGQAYFTFKAKRN